ncbi:MAG: PDZ domain-containing protein, partial [Planctomycetota bacterium]
MNRHGPRPLRSFTLPRALLGLLLLLLVGILGVGRRATAEEGLPEKPPEEDRRIARAVGYLLGHLHISRHPLDDEISRRCLQGFLKILDPRKIYFLQRDADELSRSSEELDDMVRKGDLSFPYRAFRRFLERVDERGRWAEELVHAEHDYTVDESLELDPEGTSYPKSEAEARERWRKLVKYELLLEITGDATLEEAREKLSKRYERFVRRMHQTDRHELLEMFLTSLASGYDPHTTYMSAYSLDNFEIHLRLELDGIGAMLTMEDGHTTVRSIIPGGAADRDGRLKPKDRIVAVGQGPAGETVDVVGMKLSDVVQMIRGKRGDIVRLKVLPVGGTEAVVYDITRARIELKDRVAEGEVFEHGRRPDGSPYKIGVIDLPSF